MVKEESLFKLLQNLFSSRQELIEFVKAFGNESSISNEFSPTSTMQQLLLETVEYLLRRGLIDEELFEQLIELRPKKAGLIRQVQSQLLNVDEWGETPKKEKIQKTSSPSLFVLYTHRDERFYDELSVHLKLLERKRVIEIWDEGRIGAGEEWDKVIRTQIQQAAIIILLVSPSFLSSGFIWENLLLEAIDRNKRGEVAIIPIIVRKCAWQDYPPLLFFQALPTDGIPVAESSDIDHTWVAIANKLSQVANHWRNKK